MSARDELVERIRGEISHHISPVVGWLRMDAAKGRVDSDQDRLTAFDERLAKAASGVVATILAAGYRKPRTITTAEELDALPVKAVVKGNWLAEKWATPEGDVWFIAGRNMEWFTDDLVMRGGLPATVLHEPEAEA